MTERTLVLIKPDAVARGYVGEILSRIERKGLTIAALDLRVASEEVAGSHYAEHAERPFYPSLLEFITSGPLVAAVLEGPPSHRCFPSVGRRNRPGRQGSSGTIRGDFGLEAQQNLVHGSDSVESAEREIALWFPALSSI